MELTRLAGQRVISTRPRATVQEACELMVAEAVGAIVVLDDGKLVGILSERDIVKRVVAARLDPSTTPVADVMTSKVTTVTSDVGSQRALELMHEGAFRHLPLVDRAGAVIGMVSVRDLLRDRIGELDLKNTDLLNYISTDGAGG